MLLNTDNFNWHKDSRTFTAEVSDFGDQRNSLFQTINSFAQLRGFKLKSARTGVVINMVLVGTHYDREGDLTHWTFKTIDCPLVKELIVFND